MADPLGILALLIITANPSDPGEFVWATDETAPMQQAAYYGNGPHRPADRLSSLSNADVAFDPGMAYATDNLATAAAFQGVNPFQEESPAAIAQPQSPTPAHRPGTLPEANGSPLVDEIPSTYGQSTASCGTGARGINGSCGSCAESDCVSCACRKRERGLLGSIYYDGWIAQGFTVNAEGPRNNLNFPVGFNDQANEYQMSQIYMLLEKPIDDSGYGWDVGGRVDLLYGTDSKFTMSRGLETHEDFSDKWNSDRYGLAMPQLYMEVYAPWQNGLSLKLGHFYTIIGYESNPAAENFFYSHSYALQYGEPVTHTGFIGSTRLGQITFHAGMTRGWDNWSDNNNDLDFIAGMNHTSEDGRTSISYAIVGGREQDEGPQNSNFRTLFSLVVQHQVNDRFRYVAQYDHGYDEFGANGGQRDADWFGVNQYLFYRINCNWEFGVRYEWFRDEDGARIVDQQGGDYFEATAGFNIRPTNQITIRPEFRWDWVDTPGFDPFVDGRRHDQILVACDVIVRF